MAGDLSEHLIGAYVGESGDHELMGYSISINATGLTFVEGGKFPVR